jgi:predicted enzyme related to lactoylglutathione lyase
LFDWSVDEDPDCGGYALVDPASGDGSITGGIGPSTEEGDTGVKIDVRVDDLAEYLQRAELLGGRRLVEPAELLGGFGTFAVLADPDGNHVGLWA